MVRTKTGNVYDTVKIPSGLTKMIDEMLNCGMHGFTSRTDVIKYAVRSIYDIHKEKFV